MSTTASGLRAAHASLPPIGPERFDIGAILLKFVFPPVYALTVLPFTVKVFRSVVSVPTSGARLLGLFPLGPVHEFFLPLFVLALELISMQLSRGFWKSRRRGRALVLLGVFLLFQAFPAFSVFFDARTTEFENIQATRAAELRIDPEEQRLADQRYETALGIYNGDLATWKADKDQLAAQIEATRAEIARILSQRQDALARLRAPGTLAERTTAERENDRLASTTADLTRQIDGLQGQWNALASRPPRAPQHEDLRAKPAPMRWASAIDYIVDTAGSVNSYLAMFFATMFVAIVFGAGAVIAGTEGGGREDAQMSPLEIGRELTFVAGLPAARQLAFVRQLQSTIGYQVAAHRALHHQSVALGTLQMTGDGEVDELRLLATFRMSVATSQISEGAKEVLLRFIDQVLFEPGEPHEPDKG